MALRFQAANRGWDSFTSPTQASSSGQGKPRRLKVLKWSRRSSLIRLARTYLQAFKGMNLGPDLDGPGWKPAIGEGD